MGCAGSNTSAESVESISKAPSKALERDFHTEYVLNEKLGEGAYAVVYAATQSKGKNDQVAVKVVDIRDVVSKDLDFDDETMCVDRYRQKTFNNEVAMLRAVCGEDNVCRMCEHFVHGGLGYIVLELCDRSLLGALAGCPAVNEETLRPFFRGMLTGIAAVHARRIVHRDVKPDNFMCHGPDNTVKLCDVGLAGALSWSDVVYNTDCARRDVGTPPFMAPEILEHKEYGAKVDVWSFGVVVHVLICGCFPYTPREMTSAAMKAAIVKGFPASKILSTAGGRGGSSGGVSEDAKRLIVNAMSRSEKVRPTCQEALQDEFFTSKGLSQVCLRGMLEAAQQCGACDDMTAHRAHLGDVDLRLRDLQGRRLENTASATGSPLSEASTETGSMSGVCGRNNEGAAGR